MAPTSAMETALQLQLAVLTGLYSAWQIHVMDGSGFRNTVLKERAEIKRLAIQLTSIQ